MWECKSRIKEIEQWENGKRMLKGGRSIIEAIKDISNEARKTDDLAEDFLEKNLNKFLKPIFLNEFWLY